MYQSRCVICFQILKPEPPEHPPSSESGSEKTLEKELLVMFFIKKFLKCSLISEDEGFLEFLLMNQGNPSEWVQFCSACSETVLEARKLHIALLEMESKLQTLRNLIQVKVAKSFDDFSEEIQKQLVQDPKENETFCSIRQSIFSMYKNNSFSTIPCQVNIKEEHASDFETEWPEPIFPAIEEHILIPEGQQKFLKTEDVLAEEFRNSGHSLTKRMKASIKKSSKNVNRPDRSSVLSFKTKRTRGLRGPKKSSVESRTCPVCRLIFDKPSRMTRHLSSQHNDSNSSRSLVAGPKRKQRNLIHHEEVSNSVSSTDAASIDEILNVGDSDQKEKLSVSQSQGRVRKPVSYKYEYESEGNDSDDDVEKDLIKLTKNVKNNSDSDYSHPEDEDDSENNDEATPDTEDKLAKPRNRSKQSVKQKRSINKQLNMEKRTCSICQKLFKRRTDMQIHMRCVHEKSTSYPCKLCDKKFSWRSGLRGHIKRTHDAGWIDVRPFKCPSEDCDKTFRSQCDLIRHGKIHLPNKDYLCTVCGAKFRESKTLVRHEKIHSGVKEFSCSKCGDKFRHKSNLLRHDLYIHQKDAPKKFICDQCGKSFKTKTHLDQHLQSKSHGGVGFKKPKSSSSKATKKPRHIDNIPLAIPPLQEPHNPQLNCPQFQHEAFALNQLLEFQPYGAGAHFSSGS